MSPYSLQALSIDPKLNNSAELTTDNTPKDSSFFILTWFKTQAQRDLKETSDEGDTMCVPFLSMFPARDT